MNKMEMIGEMRKLLFAILPFMAAVSVQARTEDLVRIRLDACTTTLMTNAPAFDRQAHHCLYENIVRGGQVQRESASTWYADFIGNFPDVAFTNGVGQTSAFDVIMSKRRIVREFLKCDRILSDTNAWMATARFMSRIRQEVTRMKTHGLVVDIQSQSNLWVRQRSRFKQVSENLSVVELELRNAIADVILKRGVRLLPDECKTVIISNVCAEARFTTEEIQAVLQGRALPTQQVWRPENDPEWKREDGVWIGPLRE